MSAFASMTFVLTLDERWLLADACLYATDAIWEKLDDPNAILHYSKADIVRMEQRVEDYHALFRRLNGADGD